MLKNYAMLGIGRGPDGKVGVAAPGNFGSHMQMVSTIVYIRICLSV